MKLRKLFNVYTIGIIIGVAAILYVIVSDVIDYQNNLKLYQIASKMPNDLEYIAYNFISKQKKGIVKSEKLQRVIIDLLKEKHDPELPIPRRGGPYSYINFKIKLKRSNSFPVSVAIDKEKNIIYLTKVYNGSSLRHNINDKNLTYSNKLISLILNEKN